MSARVFIDGDVGTTGLQIRARLEGRDDIDLLRLDEAARKDPAARKDMLNGADIAILCLPDDAARDAVAMIEDGSVRVIDASTAHRTHDDWVYGLPEYDAGQPARIAGARFVSNPGCYALSSIAILHPLVAAGIVPKDHGVTINAVSGYSGGGRKLIEAFESREIDTPFRVYGLGLDHKHVPEIQARCGLTRRPLFVPSVGRFSQGMIVQVPLHLEDLPGQRSAADIHGALAAHYAGRTFVTVAEMRPGLDHLDPEALNGTNQLRLHVFANGGLAVLVAVLDNLGKGASGQAVQNMNIMLGLPEGTGLEPAASSNSKGH
jgi:N-acetyl-gamma-glutamyl-phosphate reductase